MGVAFAAMNLEGYLLSKFGDEPASIQVMMLTWCF